MQIRIIEPAEMSDAVVAWTLSRDKDADYTADTVAKVDAPVIEMPSALLEFCDFAIYEREIICSLRNHVVWARTSRVDDPCEFTVPHPYMVKTHEFYRRRMQAARHKGERQDDWRVELPLVAHTSWTQRISLRDLARLALYFGYLMDKAELRTMGARFAQIQFAIVECVVAMIGHRLASDLISNCKLAKFLHEQRLPINSDATTIQNFQSVSVQVNVALRAQIIRHRELQFVDDFWSLINTTELPYLQLKHKVNMQLMARKDIWRAVLGKRSCWIAQTDLWKPVLDAFGLDQNLPCDSGKCPYEADARARLVPGQDPNPPCPVFCNLYKIPKDTHMAAMKGEAMRRGAFWIAEVLR